MFGGIYPFAVCQPLGLLEQRLEEICLVDRRLQGDTPGGGDRKFVACEWIASTEYAS
ncbi:MAG: hypothetical protein ACREVH_03065 [Gammaproteobacteria bacterium]